MAGERSTHDGVHLCVVRGTLDPDDDIPCHEGRSCQRWQDLAVSATPVAIRAALDADRVPLAMLFAAVAEERDGIATEPPVDVEARAASWLLDGTLVAVSDEAIVGSLHIQASRHGFGDLGMTVARDWRGRGVGSALLAAGITWARERGLHKLSLAVFPHNAAAIALYRKYGFVEEGRRVAQYRRANGELWDAIDMGLIL
jgi:ribosomal protein S18 acetylase RimI-like enzyme